MSIKLFEDVGYVDIEGKGSFELHDATPEILALLRAYSDKAQSFDISDAGVYREMLDEAKSLLAGIFVDEDAVERIFVDSERLSNYVLVMAEAVRVFNEVNGNDRLIEMTADLLPMT